jgi:hypothetical protein
MTTLPDYHIFKRRDGETLFWIEAALDLDAATARIKEFKKSSGEEYFIFDQRTQQIVVRCPTL